MKSPSLKSSPLLTLLLAAAPAAVLAAPVETWLPAASASAASRPLLPAAASSHRLLLSKPSLAPPRSAAVSPVSKPMVKAAAKPGVKAAPGASSPATKVAKAATSVKTAAALKATTPSVEPAREAWLALSSDAARLAQWVRINSDNQGQPFAIIDKRHARLFVFDPQGSLRGNAPVLLGLAPGDHSVPGIGERPIGQIRPEERTTPAGRFQAEHGLNANGEDIIWIDYDAAVSMHRVRPTNPKERRLQRLASTTVADNRISYGCVNVPKSFYEKVLLKTFIRSDRPVVYVLPETRNMNEVFAGFPSRASAQHASVQAVSAR